MERPDLRPILDALSELQSALASVEEPEIGGLNWRTIRDAMLVTRQRIALTQNLESVIAPAELRRLESLLDYISSAYHVDDPNGEIGPVSHNEAQTLRQLIAVFYDVLQEPPIAQTASRSVLLFGRKDEPIVRGHRKPRLTDARYDIVLALLQAGDNGLSKDQLDHKSCHTEARKILKRLAHSDPDWARVIQFPGSRGRGYRIL